MYDVIIIGGGPAGYLAAERAGEHGLKTLLFERRSLGGVCLNEGCIPSKALLYSAKIYDFAKGYGEKYGVTCENPKIDYEYAVRRKNKVVKKLVAGIDFKLKKLKVEIINKQAVIESKISGGFCVVAEGQKYEAKNVIVAAGSKAVVPPIEGLKDALTNGFAMTNREILDLNVIPKKLVIVGGGVIGLEMASLFNSVGSEVTVIEMMDKIAGPMDSEISSILQKNYEKKGVKFELSAKVTKFTNGSVSYEKDSKSFTIEADKCLVSIGRSADTQGLGLESLNVVTERGAVVTDEQMKTSVSGLFAAGDVNGKSMLAHTAYREAEVAINTILGIKDRMKYSAIPAVIYTNPEVAGIGETLQTAKDKGINGAYEVTLPMQYSGRYVAENEGGDGICKIIFDKDDFILGIHMICNYASEIVSACAVIIERKMDIKAVNKVVFPHPSVGEIIKEVINNKKH